MRNSKGNREERKIMHSKPVLVILGIIIIVFAWNITGFIGKMKETARNKKIAENNMRELEQTRIKLSADIANLQTEKGVEENIREKFGLAKEGESMIVIVEEKNPSAETTEKKQSGFFSFIKNLFK